MFNLARGVRRVGLLRVKWTVLPGLGVTVDEAFVHCRAESVIEIR